MGKRPRKEPLIRAGIVTDIHYGIDVGSKLGSKAPRLMTAFAKAASLYQPDFVVDIGDRISGRNPRDDRVCMEALQTYFNRLAVPVYTVIGNHDIRFLTRADNEQITGRPASSWSMDYGPIHFLFWNPEIIRNAAGLHVRPEDIDWLRDDLSKTDKRSLVFSHIPLDHEPPAAPNPHEHIAMRFHLSESGKIRKVLEESGKVALCMSGHVHRNHRSQINGVHYVSQQSLTQMHQKHYRVPARAWSWLEIFDDEIVIRLKGKVEKNYHIRLEPQAPRAA